MDPFILWATQNVNLFFLVFCRVGTAMIVMPAFGENRIPQRVRIAVGVMTSFCMMAALPLPDIPEKTSLMVGLFAREILIGIFFGMALRLFIVTLHILGGVVGYATSLSNAFAPPDANFEGATAISALLHVTMIALIFVTNTHHIIIMGIMRSYEKIPVGSFMIADMTEQMARLGAAAFYIAIMVGAPFIVFTILLNLALGLANRVMPTMQVFFVAGPGIILIGLAILAAATPSILNEVLSEMSSWLTTLER